MITRLTRVLTDCTDPYENLALEKSLTFHAEPGECILYLWQNRRTVVIGRNQDARRECRVDLLEAEGGHLARRLSGGGAVYHDLGNLNFSFCLRAEDYEPARQLSVVLRAAEVLGVPAEINGRNDLEAAGKKFSGNAFFRSGEFRCHHGTLLLAEDTGLMNRYLSVDHEKLKARSVASVRARVGNLREFVPGLEIHTLQEVLLKAFEEVYGLPAMPLEQGRIPVQELERGRAFFASPVWRFGREETLLPGNRDLFRKRTAEQNGGRCMVSEGRFAWGGVRVELYVKNGRVEDCRVWSDALDAEWPRMLGEYLRDCPYGQEALSEAVRRLGKTTAEEGRLYFEGFGKAGAGQWERIARDTAALLCKSFEKDVL